MQNENKLGVMPIKKLIWNMSLPIIISMLVQALYNIVDSVFVSWVSEASLTAVSLAFPAQNLMISLAAGTAVGVNALMGRALGAKDQKRADTVAMNGLFLALVGFALCAVLGLTLSDFYFRSQTDVEEIIQMGNQYLMIVMGASFGAFGQMMLERLLQGTGHSILSMYTQGAGAIINIILDPIFIFVFKMGVAGAAVATVIGQIFACVFALVLNGASPGVPGLPAQLAHHRQYLRHRPAVGSDDGHRLGDDLPHEQDPHHLSLRPGDRRHSLRHLLQAQQLCVHARVRPE